MQEPSSADPSRLELAEWRRLTAELYAEVRRLAARDPADACRVWRETREAMYRGHPQSPVPPDARSSFRAAHFPYDPALRFELPLVPDESPSSEAAAALRAPVATPGGPPGRGISIIGGPAALPVSTGQPRSFDRIGWVELPLPGGSRRLAVYWLAEYSGGLFIPFGDATNGRETYGAGRYLLDSAKGADLGGDPGRGTIVADLNFAYQPSCAFDPRWSCPLAPPENRLDVAIRAGERIA